MTERIYLTEDKNVYLDAMCLDPYNGLPLRGAMLVCPGGAYSHLADHEGEPIGAQFFADDYNVFILHYSVKKERMATDGGVPLPLLEASLAMAHIRRNAEHFGIDPHRVAVIGFSAGGHLAACLATRWNDEALIRAAGIKKGENKPDAALLGYAVSAPEPGEGLFDWLKTALFGCFDDERAARFTENWLPHRFVDESTCPCFIWHTATDEVVPVTQAYRMSAALYKKAIPHEVLIFPDGRHGLSGGIEGSPIDCDTYITRWIPQALKWLTYNFGTN